MKKVFTKGMLLCAAMIMLTNGCGDKREEAIHANKGAYETWLKQARPYLAALPAGMVVEAESGQILRDEQRYPMFDYVLKPSGAEAVITLSYVVGIDDKYEASGILSETFQFITLAARTEREASDGRTLVSYRGIPLTPSELQAVIQRAVDGDRFMDLQIKVIRQGEMLRSTDSEFDTWGALRARK